MATHTILSQYIEWLHLMKTWASEQTKLSVFMVFLGTWIGYSIVVYTYRLFLHPLSNYPGPRLAAASYIYEIYHDVSKEDMSYKMDELHRKYGPIVRISPNKLRLRKSTAWHEIHRMGSPLTKDPSFYQLFGLGGSTFATLDPIAHKRKRRALDPMFSRRSIMGIEDLVQLKTNLLCDKIKQVEAQGGIVQFYNAFVALTADVITEYTYAKSYNILSNVGFRSKLADAFDAQHEVFMVLKSFPLVSTVLFHLPPWLLMKVFPDGAGFRELEADAEVQLNQLFDRKRNGEKSTRRTVFEDVLDNHPDPQNASVEEFVHEATSVVAAGLHTTQWILTVGTIRVAQDPEVLSKLVQELKQAIPNVNDSLPYRELEKLPYLRGVVNEALRLGYGVEGGSPRLVPAEGAVIGGYHLPGGSIIEMDHHSISHDEEIFPDSFKFNPDRWIGPNAKSNEKYVVAFGAGSRQCLGINLAYCELYVVFAYLFRRFEVDLDGKELRWVDHWMPILRSERLAGRVKLRQE